MAELIRARGVSVGHAKKPVLEGIDLDLHSGEILCLLGPNGAGKTTLFRSLLGLLPVLRGALLLSGQAISTLDHRRIAERVAYVPQAQHLPFAFTARDIVLMGRSAALGPFALPGPRDLRLCDEIFARLGITDLAKADMTRLSGGQQQMVLIARALVQQAPALVLDEPTASLDLGNQRRITDLLRQLSGEGIGVILSTHDPDQAALLADRVILLGRGGMIASGPVDETMTAEALTEVYATPIRREKLSDGRLHFRAASSP